MLMGWEEWSTRVALEPIGLLLNRAGSRVQVFLIPVTPSKLAKLGVISENHADDT